MKRYSAALRRSLNRRLPMASATDQQAMLDWLAGQKGAMLSLL
jgi:hypothetical protein